MSAPTIRPAGPGDAAARARLVAAAFGDEAAQVNGVLDDLQAAGLLRHELVAEGEGEPVGYVALSAAWLDARERLVDVLLLSPVAVAPPQQGRGVGTALLEAAGGTAARAGAPAVFLEGDPGWYGPRGWEPAADHGVAAPSARIPGPAFQVRLLSGHAPWMRGRVVYPDAWWRRDLVGLRDPALAEVEQQLGCA